MKSILYSCRTEIRPAPLNLKNKDKKLFEHEFKLEIKETYLFILKNISIFNEEIFKFSRLKFYNAFSHVVSPAKKRLLKKVLLFILPSQKIGKAIWIIDEYSDAYFHWFTDALTRLIAIEKANLETPLRADYKIILPLAYKNAPYIQQSLHILNYQIHYYNTKRRLKVKTFITATHTAPTGNYNVEIINHLRERFLKTAIQPASRDIYISRAKAEKRKIINEDAVIDLLLQYNYEIHFFEDYHLDQQLEIMAQAKSIIGLHGAGLTNMLFMPEKGQILELRHEGDAHNNCYFSLASALKHDYYYLTNAGDRQDTHTVNIQVNITELKQVVELMINTHI